MSKKNATYNFNANLINASHNKELENAKKEWEFVMEETREIADGHCICQRKVKNVIYMYNTQTKNTICVGSTCHKKFNMSDNKINRDLSKIINRYLEKGEYQIIDNIIVYCQSIQNELISSFENEYKLCSSHGTTWDNGYILKEQDYIPECLKKLSNKINVLITDYNLEYLQDIYNTVNNKINELYEERKKYEETKIYCLKTFYYDSEEREQSEKKYYYTSLEKCQKHISKLPEIGVAISYRGYQFRHYATEITLLKYEILCENQLIQKTQCIENWFLENYKYEFMGVKSNEAKILIKNKKYNVITINELNELYMVENNLHNVSETTFRDKLREIEDVSEYIKKSKSRGVYIIRQWVKK